MSWIDDLFTFFTSIFSGDEADRKLRDALGMAKNYMRWGETNGSLKDFLNAFRELQASSDMEVRDHALLIEKYTYMCDSAVKAGEIMTEQFDTEQQQRMALLADLEKQVAFQQKRIETCENQLNEYIANNSTVLVDREQKKLKGLVMKLNSLQKELEGVENAFSVGSAHAKLHEALNTFASGLQQARQEIEHLEQLPPDSRTRIAERIADTAVHLQKWLDERHPEAQAAAADEAAEVPGEEGEDEAQAGEDASSEEPPDDPQPQTGAHMV